MAPTQSTAVGTVSATDFSWSASAGAVTAMVLVSLLWVPDYGYRFWFSWARWRCGGLWLLVMLVSAAYGAGVSLLATWGGFTANGHAYVAGFFTAAAAILALRTRRGSSHAVAPSTDDEAEDTPLSASDGDTEKLMQVTHGIAEQSLGKLQRWLDRTAFIGVRQWVSNLTDIEVMQYWTSVELDKLPPTTALSDADQATQSALVDAVNDRTAGSGAPRRKDLRKLIIERREGKREVKAFRANNSGRRRA